MPKKIIKEEKGGQKKLLSFRNAAFMDGMIKAEAAELKTSDSYVVEKTMNEHYLNHDPNIAEAVTDNLFLQNGMVLTYKRINQLFIEHPQQADDSLLPVLEFISRMTQKYPSDLEASDPAVNRLAGYAGEFYNVIETISGSDLSYQFLDSSGKYFQNVDRFEMIALKDISEASRSSSKLGSTNVLYLGICAVEYFWNFGGTAGSAAMKNWKGTYLLLDSILDLCEWPDYSDDKYRFGQLVKEIRLESRDRRAFDSNAQILSKFVFLNKKYFATTEDAVILHSQTGQQDGYFTEAYRVIHGPGEPLPRKPYIVLCREESDEELKQIVRQLLESYPEEFPNPSNAFLAQFLKEGQYYDNRIIWKSV